MEGRSWSAGKKARKTEKERTGMILFDHHSGKIVDFITIDRELLSGVSVVEERETSKGGREGKRKGKEGKEGREDQFQNDARE